MAFGQALRAIVTLLAAALMVATVKANPVTPGIACDEHAPWDEKDFEAKLNTLDKHAEELLDYYKGNTSLWAFNNSMNDPLKVLRLPDPHDADDICTKHQTNYLCLSEVTEIVKCIKKDNGPVNHDVELETKMVRVENSTIVARSRLPVTPSIAPSSEPICAVLDRACDNEEYMIITFRDIQTVADEMMRRYQTAPN